MDKKKKIWILGIIGAICFFALGASFAYFIVNITGIKKYVITASNLKVYLDESENIGDVVQGSKNIPVADKEGKTTTPYVFSIVNEENIPITYTIYLDEDSDSNTPKLWTSL